MDKSEGTASKAKVMDVAFYFTREDAWEESAYLLGKRPNETREETGIRRSRSANGEVTEGLSLTVAAHMGVGRVEGEYNTAGSRLHEVDDDDRLDQGSPAELAVAAVNAVQATLVGRRCGTFPHTYRDQVTLREAAVVAVQSERVHIQIYSTDGSPAGRLWVSKDLALHVFGRPAGPFGQALGALSGP